MSNQISRNLIEVMRDEMTMKDIIIHCLNEGPKTIPEIAKKLNYPEYETTYWVMAMWRYGHIEEVGKPDSDGYYKYQPTK